VVVDRPLNLDLPGKLRLMRELGIIDLLKNRYAGMDSLSWENKVAEILCLITGETFDQKEPVLQALSTLRSQGENGHTKNSANRIHQRILRLNSGK